MYASPGERSRVRQLGSINSAPNGLSLLTMPSSRRFEPVWVILKLVSAIPHRNANTGRIPSFVTVKDFEKNSASLSVVGSDTVKCGKNEKKKVTNASTVATASKKSMVCFVGLRQSRKCIHCPWIFAGLCLLFSVASIL